MPKKTDQFFDYFVFDPRTTAPDEEEVATIKSAPRREAFYNAVKVLITRYSAIALDMERAGYTAEEVQEIFNKVKNYDDIRTAIMRRAGDIIDMKQYDQSMRQILDTYVEARHSKVLAMLDDFSFLDLVIEGNSEEAEEEAEEALGGKEGVASTITANVRRVINRKRESNPEEYRKLSERINRLLDEYRQGVVEYKEYLKAIAELAKELREQTSDPRLDTPGKRALYDNLGENIDLTLEVYNCIKENAKVGFRENPVKKKKLRRELEKIAAVTPFNVDDIMSITIHNPEF